MVWAARILNLARPLLSINVLKVRKSALSGSSRTIIEDNLKIVHFIAFHGDILGKEFDHMHSSRWMVTIRFCLRKVRTIGESRVSCVCSTCQPCFSEILLIWPATGTAILSKTSPAFWFPIPWIKRIAASCFQFLINFGCVLFGSLVASDEFPVLRDSLWVCAVVLAINLSFEILRNCLRLRWYRMNWITVRSKLVDSWIIVSFNYFSQSWVCRSLFCRRALPLGAGVEIEAIAARSWVGPIEILDARQNQNCAHKYEAVSESRFLVAEVRSCYWYPDTSFVAYFL